jgi:NitT/TauT family transport system substrate-binding protein
MVSRATKRARLVGVAGLVSVALVTAACSGSGSGDQSASGSSSGGVQTLKVAAGSKLLTDWDDYVAEAKGYYADHGVKVDRVTTQTASAATQLQVTGEISVGRGLPPAVQADVKSNGGIKLIDVADTLVRPPFTVNAASSINGYQDLAGKTVAVSTPTDSTTVVTQEALSKLGISTDKIDMNPVGGTAERLAGLEQGAVQATLMLPPLNFKAEGEGFHRIGYIPDDLGQNFKFAFTSVIVNSDWAKKNKDLLVNYLRSRNDALKFMADKNNREAVSSILAKATDIDDATAQQIYDLTIGGKYSAFNDRIGVDTGAAQGVLDGLELGGFLKTREKAATYTDDSYAKDARNDG